MARETVISLMTEAVFQVYMIGFMPGFPYMGGLPAELEMPRLSSPRKAVPARSLAVAGSMCAIYPWESPGGWRELLGGAGVRSASISDSGVFKDASTDERARQIFFDGEMPDFQVIIPNFGIVQGAFLITAIEYSGSYNGEATYEMTLASAGQLSFTAV